MWDSRNITNCSLSHHHFQVTMIYFYVIMNNWNLNIYCEISKGLMYMVKIHIVKVTDSWLRFIYCISPNGTMWGITLKNTFKSKYLYGTCYRNKHTFAFCKRCHTTAHYSWTISTNVHKLAFLLPECKRQTGPSTHQTMLNHMILSNPKKKKMMISSVRHA